MQAGKIRQIRKKSKSSNEEKSEVLENVANQDDKEEPQALLGSGDERRTPSQHSFEPIDFFNKTQALRNALEKDLMACDAKWTLFVATAFSYRNEIKLKPFPPRFSYDQTGRQIDALISVINDTPKLNVVLHNLIRRNFENVDPEVIELLYWVLITQREPSLSLVNFDEISDSLEEMEAGQKPTHIFELIALEGFHSDTAFKERIMNLPTKFGFYAQSLDSYYSIIYNGWTEDTDGETIKLSTDLLSSLQKTPCGAAWGASQCGSLISCIGVFEYADESDGGERPNGKELVVHPLKTRLRYLLFYGSRYPMEDKPQEFGIKAWVLRHKYTITLVAYTLLISTIAIANSGDRGDYIKTFAAKKVGNILAFCRKFFV
ncbi:poly(ADP-ribose) polymerase 16 [Musca autumnalis]|uniref:poly(ADP-ribose) polymerase 16 n=1 Tax=Musca autumnalis TaxID=221902 RepID=UPI003CEE88BB